MGDNTNPDDRSPLLPDRYPQQDFFVCNVFDAAPKGDMASMEHPLFSIRSEEHTSELQSLMRISYAVFCLKKTTTQKDITNKPTQVPQDKSYYSNSHTPTNKQ